jgi:hypothetical protein
MTHKKNGPYLRSPFLEKCIIPAYTIAVDICDRIIRFGLQPLE